MKLAVLTDSPYGLRAWEGTASPMPRAHRHHELELNYVVRGTMRYLISGKVVTLPPRRLCALWGAVPHQAIEPGSSDFIWVTVPLARALTWDLPGGLMRRLLGAGIVIERGERAGDVLLLRQWIDDLRAGTRASPPTATLLEMEARLRRMATRLQRSPNARSPIRRPAGEASLPRSVEILARFVAANFREPLSMANVAKAAHLHPHYAMRLFREHTGLTLHQYLTLQRVAHAQRLLMTTRTSILEIAFESGFQSVSRFYEAFKKQLGVSPRAYRARLAEPMRD